MRCHSERSEESHRNTRVTPIANDADSRTRISHPPLGRFLASARNDDTRKSAGSDFQLLRKTRENLAAGLRHYDHVFMPDSAEPGIIKSRLDRQHLSIFQGHLLQPRIFMDLQAEPVAGAVEKSNVFPFANFGGIAALLEKLLDRLVDFHSVDPGFDFPERELLPFLHGLPELALRFTSASAHDGARQIAPITRLRVALRPEDPVCCCKIDIVPGERAGEAERKIRRHKRAFYSA